MREQLQYTGGASDGEFWITIQDFVKHYYTVHICNFTPDFDNDGQPDGLGKLSSSFTAKQFAKFARFEVRQELCRVTLTLLDFDQSEVPLTTETSLCVSQASCICLK